MSLFASGVAWAHQAQEGDIRATAATQFYRNDVRDHDFSPPWLQSVGLIVEGDIDNHGGLEISAFYLRQFYSIQKDGLVLDETGKRMYITMGYRHWFNTRLSSAIAFFSSYTMGDPAIQRNDFGTGPRPTTSAKDVVDYGFDFSVQYEPWREGRWAAVVDARYSLSVTSKPGEAGNFYGFLVGLKYFVQGQEANAVALPVKK